MVEDLTKIRSSNSVTQVWWELCGGTQNKGPSNCAPSRGGRGNEQTLTLSPATVPYRPRLALDHYIRLLRDFLTLLHSSISNLILINILFCLFIIIHPHSSFPTYNRAYCDSLVFVTVEIQTREPPQYIKNH